MTLHEWYWMLVGHDRREVVEYRRFRKLLTLIHNVNVKKGDQRKEHQIFPLPGDEAYILGDKLMNFVNMDKVASGEQTDGQIIRVPK